MLNVFSVVIDCNKWRMSLCFCASVWYIYLHPSFKVQSPENAKHTCNVPENILQMVWKRWPLSKHQVFATSNKTTDVVREEPTGNMMSPDSHPEFMFVEVFVFRATRYSVHSLKVT